VTGQEVEYDVHLPMLLLLLPLLLQQTCINANHGFQHSIPVSSRGQPAVPLFLSHSQVCDCESEQEV